MQTKPLVMMTAATLTVFATATATAQVSLAWNDPSGGWTYSYTEGASSGSGGFTALDGSWSHDNNSDCWDGTTIGTGAPGGVSSVTEGGVTYTRIQDAGDPSDYGIPVPDSDKLYFGKDVSNSGHTLLNDGVTLLFRARVPTSGTLDSLYPDPGGGIVDYPTAGDGFVIKNAGKGHFGLRQYGSGFLKPGGIISFSLATSFDTIGPVATGQSGLFMNNLNGTMPTSEVDYGELGTANYLLFDTTTWHEFWITIQAGGIGTHQVNVYMDGSTTPATFDVTSATGVENEFSSLSYLAMGLNNTVDSGSLDVDFFAMKPGVYMPTTGVPPPNAVTLAIMSGGANALIVYPSQNGYSYQLQSRTNMASGSWADENAPQPGTGGPLTNTISASSEPQKYFRVLTQ